MSRQIRYLFLLQNFANPACEGGCGGGDPREEEDRRFKYRLVLDRMRELKDKDVGGRRERTHDKDCEGENIPRTGHFGYKYIPTHPLFQTGIV